MGGKMSIHTQRLIEVDARLATQGYFISAVNTQVKLMFLYFIALDFFL